MRRVDLANRLISAVNSAERMLLLAQNPKLADAGLAREIRKACYAAWAVEPVKAQRADLAMRCLATINDNEQIQAVALWVAGISSITKGKFESAVAALDNASASFERIGGTDESAQTQVAKLIALAMLGRYEEAIATGQKALKIFVRAGDELAAGKIEMNLSNIVSRRALHREAEKYCASALRRFRKAGERSWQTMAENGLANTYAELNEFQKAGRYYRQALDGAISEKMPVTEAEIEASLGNLELLRGRFADALNYLESSRQKYDELGMPHQSAIADLEVADIYSELDLATEAIEIYERVTRSFRQLKLTAEEARARLNYGITLANVGNGSKAKQELKKALKLFGKEQNLTGEASALLALAKIAIDGSEFQNAKTTVSAAAQAVRHSENPRHQMRLCLLEGELFRQTGKVAKAVAKFSRSLKLAETHAQINTKQHVLNELGEIAAGRGETHKARALFSRAIKTIETMRSPLDADEISMAFLASKLKPYDNLARLYLSQNKVTEAFRVIESGRSRSLLDALAPRSSKRPVSIKLQKQSSEIRTELNVYYKRLEVATGSAAEKLRSDIRSLESDFAKTDRQMSSLGLGSKTPGTNGEGFDAGRLKKQIGQNATFVEYVEFDGSISAFVVGGQTLRFVQNITTSSAVREAIEDLQFQFGALRYGSVLAKRFVSEIKSRTDDCLKKLYDQLLRPIEGLVSGERIMIVPVGVLHYVPFHGLHNGDSYAIENYETSYAPSAAVWSVLHARPVRKVKNALLVGYADEKIPFVEDEIRQIEATLPLAKTRTKTLIGSNAGYAAFIENASKYDLIHLACHGQFRAENPMFSSLQLSDGWITVRDICSQKLKARLVTLSACETGLNKVFAGDEILGLARGFLTAGAGALIVSLWSINDEASGRFMSQLYNHLQRGESISASLRKAQIGFIGRGEHPFYWSPFILIGK